MYVCKQDLNVGNSHIDVPKLKGVDSDFEHF